MTNLVIFQHGDYAEAYRNLRSGGKETYREQKSSVDFVATLTDRFDLSILCVNAEGRAEALQPRMRSIGIPEEEAFSHTALSRHLSSLEPELIICRSVNEPLLRWATRNQVTTLVSLADNFRNKSLRTRWRNTRFARAISSPNVTCVANHSLRASISVRDVLRYPEDRIVPWDWQPLDTSPPRPDLEPGSEIVVFYAGRLSEVKGVGDCLEALKLLRRDGLNIRFEFAGEGDLGDWRRRAEAIGVGAEATFLGIVPNDEVRNRLRQCTLAVVPSWHAYPEGLPNGIYEALAASTPLIVSDHPAFNDRLEDGRDWLVYPAGDTAALANSIRRLATDATLYRRLTSNAQAAHDKLYIGINWMDLVEAFLNDPHNGSGWVQRHSLAAVAGH